MSDYTPRLAGPPRGDRIAARRAELHEAAYRLTGDDAAAAPVVDGLSGWEGDDEAFARTLADLLVAGGAPFLSDSRERIAATREG